ncbi:MAG: hypothetical protein U0P30_00070 [Vicinamibacterales bacterium]
MVRARHHHFVAGRELVRHATRQHLHQLRGGGPHHHFLGPARAFTKAAIPLLRLLHAGAGALSDTA